MLSFLRKEAFGPVFLFILLLLIPQWPVFSAIAGIKLPLPGLKPAVPSVYLDYRVPAMPQTLGIRPGVKPDFQAPDFQASDFQARDTEPPGPILCNLTFDDGPHPRYDPKILDILAHYNAPATFYLVGQNIKRYPDVARSMVQQGHEIGNHTWSHANLKKVSPDEVVRDLRKTSQIIKETTGSDPYVFRPPYGNHTPHVLATVRDMGMKMILWDVDSLDWKHRDAVKTADEVLKNTNSDSVILLHSIHSQTVAALPRIIEGLLKKGCYFVTSRQWFDAVKG